MRAMICFIYFMFGLAVKFVRCYFQTLGIVWPIRGLPIYGTVDVVVYYKSDRPMDTSKPEETMVDAVTTGEGL